MIFSAISAFVRCGPQDGSAPKGIMNIDYSQAARLIKSNPQTVILDVRTPVEFTGDLGHISGARLIPLRAISDSLNSLSEYRETDVIIACRSGRRSAIAAGELVRAGFKKVYNLSGGMIAWKAGGGKIE